MLVRRCTKKNFFSLFRKSHLIGPPSIFLEHVALPNTEKPKYAAKIYDSFSKIEACWEHLKEHNENFMGT
jgi:hypothetical protein